MPQLAAPAVDLVVATYNQPALLAACIRSLKAMPFRDYTLIVVDDGSTESVENVVAAHHPGAIVLRSKRNGGLVRAINRGIRRGTAALVGLLNDDTEVDPNWLGELVDAARQYPDAASFASKITLFPDGKRLHSAGDGFGQWGMPFNRGVWLDDVGQYDVVEPVFGACAGAALYRRSALGRVAAPSGDVFEPSLYMYLEDVDLNWRLQRAGYECRYIPSARVRHHLSATGGGTLASYYVSRNIWHVLLNSTPPGFVRTNARSIITHHFGRNLRHLQHCGSPAARASLSGTMNGFATFALWPLVRRLLGRRR